MTNKEKFEQIYGFEPDCNWCNPFPCHADDCRWWKECEGKQGCPCDGWWDMEFEPTQETADHEAKGLMAIMGDDGIFREYKDDFDITIHCESQEEQDRVKKILNQEYVSKEDIDEAISEIMRSDIPICYMDGYERAAFADGQGSAVMMLREYLQKEAADDPERTEE